MPSVCAKVYIEMQFPCDRILRASGPFLTLSGPSVSSLLVDHFVSKKAPSAEAERGQPKK
ncbi:hypothetical protein SAMN05443247_03728 [Bradyrhizobium erythrophlei]|nr:hypothetical protein SAMN05443247_03728 [Bradyrhizobium erythrophlei]